MISLNHTLAADLATQLKVSSTGDFFREFRDDPLAARTETLIHEIGHAKSLGVKIRAYFDIPIAERLRAVAPLRADRRNEALVLAAEYLIYSQTSTPISMNSLRNTAREQDVNGAQILHALQAQRTRALAVQICIWLRQHIVLSGSFRFRDT